MFNAPMMQTPSGVGDPQPGENIDNPLYKGLSIPNVKEYRILNPVASQEIFTPFQTRHILAINPSNNTVYIRVGGSGAASATGLDLVVYPGSFISVPLQAVNSFIQTPIGGDTTSAPKLILIFYDTPFEPNMGPLGGGVGSVVLNSIVGSIFPEILTAAQTNKPLWMGLNGQLVVSVTGGGAALTDAQAIVGFISAGNQSQNIVGAAAYNFNGSNSDRVRTPTVFKNLSAVVITTETTIWTPGAGKKFRLMGFCLTQGVVTGAITLRDNTAGTTILTIPQHTVGVVIPPPVLGNGILSAAANNVLTAQGAATETITGFVYGTEE